MSNDLSQDISINIIKCLISKSLNLIIHFFIFDSSPGISCSNLNSKKITLLNKNAKNANNFFTLRW